MSVSIQKSMAWLLENYAIYSALAKKNLHCKRDFNCSVYITESNSELLSSLRDEVSNIIMLDISLLLVYYCNNRG